MLYTIYFSGHIVANQIEKSNNQSKNSGNIANFMQKTAVVFTGALICCFLWGSATPCIKGGYAFFSIGSDDVPSRILFAGIRFLIAGILTVFIGSMGSKKLLLPSKSSASKIFVLSMLQTVIQYFFFYGGLAHTPGVRSAIIGALNSFVAILVAALIFRLEKLTIRKIAGCILAFAGVVVLNLAGNKSSGGAFHFNGEGFIFLSAVSYSFSSVFMKSFSKTENPVMLSGWQFVLGGFIMIAVSASFGGHLIIAEGKTVVALILMLYMAIISAVAYGIWALLLKYNKVSKVVIFGFLNPIFGVLLSAIFLHEANQTGIVTLISLALVCIGIIIVSKGKN